MSPDVLWWTDHETGDTSDWFRDAQGSTWTSGGGQLSVATEHARSGRHALRSVIVSGAGAVAERAGLLPVNGYYSAWYYVPAVVTATQYWLCFKFRSRRVATDPTTDGEAWDVDFISDGTVGMRFVLFGHASQTNEPAITETPVPIARWFQIEAFLRATNDNTGQLTIWVDGTKVFDVQARPILPSPYIQWEVGGITSGITPPNATLFVDDAAISTRRLGPDYPIFWRGD